MNPSKLVLISVLTSVLVLVLVVLILVVILVFVLAVLVVLVLVVILVSVLVLIVHFFPPKARFKFNSSTLLRSILLCKIALELYNFFEKQFFILHVKSFL